MKHTKKNNFFSSENICQNANLNPFIPNFTQIPNIIFDYWMNKLSPAEFKILLCFCRKIYGWHKTSDTISRNHLVKCTGLSKNTIKDALDSLENHGLIIKIQEMGEYGCLPNKFHLNIKIPEDALYSEPENDEKIGQNLGGGRSKFDQGVGQNLTTQNKDIQNKYKKEKITKKEKPQKKKEPSEPKKLFLDNVLLSEAEHQKLLLLHGPAVLKSLLEILDSYLGSTGKKYLSHYAVLKTGGWVMREFERRKTAVCTKKSNYEIVAEKFKHGEFYNGAECFLTNEVVAFQRGMSHFQIKFAEKGFFEQFRNMLLKFDIRETI